MVKVSVIIVNFNGKKFIKECVDSVLRGYYASHHPRDFEVVVVDNASTDGSYSYIKNQISKIKNGKGRVFRSNKQLFFTGGCNLGARKARGEKIIFLNSDCVVTKNWIYEMVKFSGNNKKWIVQPKILRKIPMCQGVSTSDVDIIDNAGTGYSFWGVARGRGYGEEDLGQYDRNEEVEICAGTCFMIDKKFFWDLGGFDESFRYQYEDVDLCLRARKMGGKCFLCYKSVVYHVGGATFRENVSSQELLYHIRKNRLMTAKKNFSGIEKIVRVFLISAGSAVLNIINGINLKLKVIEITHLVKKGKFLDVGCGDGGLMERLPYDSLGVDPKFKGAKIINTTFEKFRTDLKFDVIGFYESLEHMNDPKAAILKAGGLLKRSGVLVIEVPIFDNFVAKFLGRGYYGFNDSTHKHFFKQKEVYEMLNLTGFKPVSLGFTYLKFPFSGVGVSWKLLPVIFCKLLDLVFKKREFIRIYAVFKAL